MKDYNKYYQEQFGKIKKKLFNQYDIEVLQAKGGKSDRINFFIRKISFERDNIYQRQDPFDPDAMAYNTDKNSFKELIIKDFIMVDKDYPDDRINGFVKYEIPKQRKRHKEQFEKGNNLGRYKFDTRFMYDASTEDILDMIAKYYAYKEFLTVDYENLHNDFFGNEPSKNTGEDHFIKINTPKIPTRDRNDGFTSLTLRQTAILFRLLKDENIILNDKNYQADTEIGKAVQAMTNFNPTNIRTAMGKPLHHIDNTKNDIKELEAILQKLLVRIKNNK